MANFDKLLVAVGFTQYSAEIFQYAAQLAGRLGSDLIVATVINQRDVDQIQTIKDMGYDMDSDKYVRDIKAERQQMLDVLVEQTAFPVQRLKALFRVGNPIDALLKIILAEQVDMVIMGLKGRTDLEQILVGSVADKIFRRSPVTVVSYRDERSRQRLEQRIHS